MIKGKEPVGELSKIVSLNS